MSATEVPSDADEGAAVAPIKKPRFSKRMLIFAGAGILVLLLVAIAAFFLMQPASDTEGGAAEGHGETASAEHGGEAVTYVDAPPMVINLRAPDGAPRFLKIRFTFVPASAAKADAITSNLPLIVDSFQPFLRELRPEDLAGSAAVFRVKEELLVRATGAMGPGVVKDVLIQDLIQQ